MLVSDLHPFFRQDTFAFVGEISYFDIGTPFLGFLGGDGAGLPPEEVDGAAAAQLCLRLT